MNCGQNPRLFLRSKKGFGKVHKGREAEGNRSLLRYCRQTTKVIKELGYPKKRHTLVIWYRGYEEKGEVKDDGREEKDLKLSNNGKFETKLNYYSNFDLLCIDEFLNEKQDDSFILQKFFTRVEDLNKCTLVICCQVNPDNWIKLFSVSSFGQSVRGRIINNSKIINTQGKDLRLNK